MTQQQEEWQDRRQQLNPFTWKPKAYNLIIRCQNSFDRTGKGSVAVANVPFILDTIFHSIRNQPESAQDGNYALRFRQGPNLYNTEYAQAGTLFGGEYNNQVPLPLVTRMLLKPGQALEMELLNNAQRVAIAPIDAFIEFEIIFNGFEMWAWEGQGELKWR